MRTWATQLPDRDRSVIERALKAYDETGKVDEGDGMLLDNLLDDLDEAQTTSTVPK